MNKPRKKALAKGGSKPLNGARKPLSGGAKRHPKYRTEVEKLQERLKRKIKEINGHYDGREFSGRVNTRETAANRLEKNIVLRPGETRGDRIWNRSSEKRELDERRKGEIRTAKEGFQEEIQRLKEQYGIE